MSLDVADVILLIHWLIYFCLFCFTSSRFTETAAVPSASSFCSRTTSRSNMCLLQASRLSTCCWRWVWIRWEKTILTTWLVTFNYSSGALSLTLCLCYALWMMGHLHLCLFLRWRTDDFKPLGKLYTVSQFFSSVCQHSTDSESFPPQCFYLSTEVDLQEQVIRLRKLHHLLEIIVTCSTFLGLPYDCLFLLTQ